MPDTFNPQTFQRPVQAPVRTERMDPFFAVNRDIKALNSSILLITQKIKYIIRNEKILGRNLIILNKKIKDLREQGIQPSAGGEAFSNPAGLNSSLENLQAEIASLKEDLQSLKKISHMLELFNPLNYLTIDQAKQLIQEEVEKELKKHKK